MLKKYKYHWTFFTNNDWNVFKKVFKKTPNLKLEPEYKKSKEKWTYNNPPIFVFRKKQKIETEVYNLAFDEELAELLVEIVEKAHKFAQEIRDVKGTYGEIREGDIEATIYSLVQKWGYESQKNDNFCLLEVISDIMFSFACRHKFRDGNKRTALITGIFVLQIMGFFVKESEIPYESFWDEVMIELVETHSKGASEVEQINKLIKVIENNIRISYNS